MSKIISVVFLAAIVLTMGANLAADNYVNWKGNFWLEIPNDWEKANYRMVDAFLSMTDTSREVFNYEAVFAPEASQVFAEDAYLVITFDSTGPLSRREADSVLSGIAESYSTDVFDAPIVQIMSDLKPGRPNINRAEKVVSVLTEMAYRPDAMKKLWLYMRLNDRGLISLYFYSPDSTYNQNKPIFDRIAQSLSFENLKEAAEGETFVFSNVGGDSLADPEVAPGRAGSEEVAPAEGVSNIRNILLYAVVIIVIFGLIWNFVIAPKMRKKTTQSD